MKLTPELIRTVFEAAGVSEADRRVRALRKAYRDLPKDVRSKIRADGVPKTKADLDDLIGKSKNLSKRDIKLLLRLQGAAAASGEVKGVGRLLDILAGKKPKVRVSADSKGAKSELSSVDKKANEVTKAKRVVKVTSDTASALSSIQSFQSTVNQMNWSRTMTITTVRKEAAGGKHATGGYIRGPGTTTSDDIPAWLSDREFVARAAAVEYYGVDFFQALNSMSIPRFASGGSVGKDGKSGKSKGAVRGYADLTFDGREFTTLAEALRGLTKVTKEQTKAVDQAKATRDASQSRWDDARSAVSGRFTSTLFGEQKSPFLTSSLSHMGTLDSDITTLRATINAKNALQAKGINGNAFKTLFGEATPQELAVLKNMSVPDAKKYQEKFELRQQLDDSLSKGVADASFGAELREANGVYKQQLSQQKITNQRLKSIERDIGESKRLAKQAPVRTGRETSKGLNGAAKKGAKNVRRR